MNDMTYLLAAGVSIPAIIGIIVLILIVLILVTSCFKIVPQASAFVVERLGAYKCTWSVGFHVKVPIIDKVAKRVILKGRLWILHLSRSLQKTM